MFRVALAVLTTVCCIHCGSDASTPYAQDANAANDAAQNTNVQVSSSQNSNAQNSTGYAAGNTSTGSNSSSAASALACPNDANDTYASVRIACVQTINDYRSTLGLAPYQRWCGTARCIDQQTQADSQQQSAHSAFGNCSENAQNECPGWSTPVSAELTQCLKQMWSEGPGTDFSQHGHYINMTSTTYTQVECGLEVSGDSFWAAMDFH